MAILTTIASNLFLLLGSVIFALGAILLAPVPPRGAWSFRCALAWSRGLLWSGGVRLEIEGEEELAGGTFVFVANHQSLYDIPALLASLPVSARFMAKRSLFWLPVFGWAMRLAGFVPVDRADRRRAGRAVGAAGRVLRAGHSIVVFPEQTRSDDGALLPFKRGGFLLAMRQGVPVVPVGISGSRHVRSKGTLLVRPGTVRVRYGRPIRIDSQTRVPRGVIEQARAEVARLAGEPFRSRSGNR